MVMALWMKKAAGMQTHPHKFKLVPHLNINMYLKRPEKQMPFQPKIAKGWTRRT